MSARVKSLKVGTEFDFGPAPAFGIPNNQRCIDRYQAIDCDVPLYRGDDACIVRRGTDVD